MRTVEDRIADVIIANNWYIGDSTNWNSVKVKVQTCGLYNFPTFNNEQFIRAKQIVLSKS